MEKVQERLYISDIKSLNRIDLDIGDKKDELQDGQQHNNKIEDIEPRSKVPLQSQRNHLWEKLDMNANSRKSGKQQFRRQAYKISEVNRFYSNSMRRKRIEDEVWFQA
jgi:hypothetical protein